jgi:hypothetical protein
MDATYFLKNRTGFIRNFYTQGAKPFAEIKHAIENCLPPFDSPEDPEPAFFGEWEDADTAVKVLGLSCISLLSDTLKLYFQTLQHRVIGFSFRDETAAFKRGFVAAYLGVLGSILETDWSDCPADLAVIEQVGLARNRGQHGGSLTSFDVTHDDKTLAKHPQPFFASEDERRIWTESGGDPDSVLAPSVEITSEALFTAIEHVEKLAAWVDSRLVRRGLGASVPRGTPCRSRGDPRV